MDNNFSLVEFIENKEVVTAETAPFICNELLKKNNFNLSEADFITKWLNALPQEELNHLWLNEFFYERLAGKKFLSCKEPNIFKYDESENFLSAYYDKLINIGFSKNTVNWMIENIKFPKIYLPSGAYFQCDGKDFLTLFVSHIEKYPHLSKAVFQLGHNRKKPINIIPDLGFSMHELAGNPGACYIFLRDSISISKKLANAPHVFFHEFGHASGLLNFFNCSDEEFSAGDRLPILSYIDEMEQCSKDLYLAAKDESLKHLKDFIGKLSVIASHKYPNLSEAMKEKYLSFEWKNFWCLFMLTDKKGQKEILNSLRKNDLITESCENYLTYCRDHYNYWLSISYPHFNTVFDWADVFKKDYLKRNPIPRFLTDIMSKDFVEKHCLSNSYLDLFNKQRCYIDLKRDNINSFCFDRIFPQKIEKQNLQQPYGLYLSTKGLDDKQISALKRFYKRHAIHLTKSKEDEVLIPADEQSSQRLMAYVVFDFIRTCAGPLKSFVFFKHDEMPLSFKQTLKKTLLSYRKRKLFENNYQSDYIHENKDGFLVEENILKKAGLSSFVTPDRTFLGVNIKPMEKNPDASYHSELKRRFKARGFNIQDIFSSSDSVLEVATFQQGADKKRISTYLRMVQKCIEVLPFNYSVKNVNKVMFPEIRATGRRIFVEKSLKESFKTRQYE